MGRVEVHNSFTATGHFVSNTEKDNVSSGQVRHSSGKAASEENDAQELAELREQLRQPPWTPPIVAS